MELRNPFFAWHSEAQFAMHDVFLSEALVSLSTLRAKVVRLVECDGSIERDEMKQHLYHGFWFWWRSVFCNLQWVQKKTRLQIIFCSWVFNTVFQNTWSLAWRHLFCQVDAMHGSHTFYQIVVCHSV